MPRPIRTPDILELRAFCLAADLGSLGKAARVLSMSQPAMSKRIQTLETLIGHPLLERSPQGVSLTPSGNRLYIEARKLLTQAESVFELMTNLSARETPVKVSVSHTIAEFVLPDLLVDYEIECKRHLAVESLIGNSSDARRMVSCGCAEFGIVAVPADEPLDRDDLIYEPFLEDEIVLAIPRSHPWVNHKMISIAQLLSTPLVVRDPGANSRRTVECALEERGLGLPVPLAEVGSTCSIANTAIAENAPALLSRLEITSDGLVERRIQGLRFTRQFLMVFRGREESLPPLTRALARYLLDHRPATQGHNQPVERRRAALRC